MIDPNYPDYTNYPGSKKRPSFLYAPMLPQAKPAITFITPFYNTGDVFYETARSVFNQSLQQWEWIIVNDASTNPRSLEILAEFRDKDDRIKVIDHEINSGPSAARNTGFREASSEYILWMDSDDLLEPTAAEKWFWNSESYPEFSFTKGFSVGFGAREYLWNKGFHLGNQFLQHNLVDITALIRKEVIENVGGFDDQIRLGLEDWGFWLRCANAGYWGGMVFEYLDWYRTRENHTDRWEHYNDVGSERFQKSISKNFPNLTPKTFPKIQPIFPGMFAKPSELLPTENLLQKKKSRLLMIVPWLRVGGADQFNANLIKLLNDADWEVTIAATLSSFHPWMPKFSQLTPDIFVLPNFLKLVDYPRFLRYLIQSRNPDVVMVTNSEFGYFMLPYLRAHFPKTTFVDYNHMEEDYWKNGCHPWESVEYQYWLDGSIVASQHLKNWMTDRGANPEIIDVCYINVDTDKFRPDPEKRKEMREELELPEDIPILIYVGRILEQKQPKVFAETIKILHKRGQNFHAIVIGDGPDFHWLKSFIKVNHLNKMVTCTGSIANTKVKDYLNAADILFLPSKWEGIALTIYEAMACGLAIVGANVGGQKELVTDEVGVLIDIDLISPDEQAEIYADILENVIENPAQMGEMKHTARERVVKHFALPDMGNQMIDLLEKANKTKEATESSKNYLHEHGNAILSLGTEYTRVFVSLDSGLQTGPVDNMILQMRWKNLIYLGLRKIFFSIYNVFGTRISWLPRFKEWLKNSMN